MQTFTYSMVYLPQCGKGDVFTNIDIAKEVHIWTFSNFSKLVDNFLQQTDLSVSPCSCMQHPTACRSSITFVSAWSGATPDLTRPNGVGSLSCKQQLGYSAKAGKGWLTV